MSIAIDTTPSIQTSFADFENGWDVRKKHYALIVIEVLTSCALEPTEGYISDLGRLQTIQADIQTKLAHIQQLMSLIEGGIQKEKKGLPDFFWLDQSNRSLFENAAHSYTTLVYSSKALPRWNDIEIYIKTRNEGGSVSSTPLSLFTEDGEIRELFTNGLEYLFGKGSEYHTLFPDLPLFSKEDPEAHLSSLQLLIVNMFQAKLNDGGIVSEYSDLFEMTAPSDFLSSDPRVSGIIDIYTALQTKWVGDGGSHIDAISLGFWDTSIHNLFLDYDLEQNHTHNDLFSESSAIFDDLAANYLRSQNLLSGGDGDSSLFGGFTEGKWLDTTSQILGSGQSYFQTQTQQNTSWMQQQSSMLASFSQIGQSIISSSNKEGEVIINNSSSQ